MLSEQKMKNIVMKKAKEFDIAPQQMYALFGLEQILKKVADSPYQENFVIKGGFLLASVYGLETRTTKDLDTTIRGMQLTEEKVQEFVRFLETPNESKASYFKVTQVRRIREQFEYDGYHLKIQFHNGRGRYPLEIDMTTGELLLPLQENKKIPLIFEDGSVSMPAYPIEQILADKLYTVLAYGSIDDTNSRSKDLYDLHFLTKVTRDIDYAAVNQAIYKAINQRKVDLSLEQAEPILIRLAQSQYQQTLWEKYRGENVFARDVTFDKVMESVARFSKDVVQHEPKVTMKERLGEARLKAETQNLDRQIGKKDWGKER